MLISYTDYVFAIGGESHTGDTVLVLLELGHLLPLCYVPYSHRWQVTTLMKNNGKGGGVNV